MAVDLWIEITEDNIERLTELYAGIFPYFKGMVVLGNYANYDSSYSTVETRLDVYESLVHIHHCSRLVDIEEFILAVFEETLNQ